MKELALRQFTLFVSILLIITNLFPFPILSRTIDEINADIEKNKQEMELINAELEKIKKELSENQSNKNSLNNEMAKVQNEINIIEKSYNLLSLQKKAIENELLSRNLEKEEKEKQQDYEVISSYISWKTDQTVNSVIINPENAIKNILYYDFINKQTVAGIKSLSTQINELSVQTKELEEESLIKENELKALLDKKAFWMNQIKLAEEEIAKTKSSQNQLVNISSQLDKQQKEYNAELEQAIANANSGSKPLITGQLYFYGSVGLPRNGIECTGNFKYYGIDPGTDAFGHGLGLSQWGAYGAANKGKTVNEILTFYYQGSSVENRPAKMITVNGVGKMTMEDYVSGLGEVPDKACGTMEKIDAWNEYANSQGWASDDPKRDKYRLSGSCWPEEAIKAQVIAARSYAYNRTDSICTSDSCQVYKGGYAKAWAAFETKDKVIVSGGQVIDAFYSGYNSNGRGTANIETVWPKSSPRSYLVSVNDSSFAYIPRLCNQNYSRLEFRTNSYSIDDLKIMLAWGEQKSNWGDYNYIEPNYWNADVVRYQINNKIGTLTGIDVLNDASGRAKRVVFTGTNGNGSVSGQFFRFLFSSWVVRTGRDDGIKGITYDIAIAE